MVRFHPLPPNSMTIEEQVEAIELANLKESLPRLFEQWEYERQVLRGEVPMPDLAPIRCPMQVVSRETKSS